MGNPKHGDPQLARFSRWHLRRSWRACPVVCPVAWPSSRGPRRVALVAWPSSRGPRRVSRRVSRRVALVAWPSSSRVAFAPRLRARMARRATRVASRPCTASSGARGSRPCMVLERQSTPSNHLRAWFTVGRGCSELRRIDEARADRVASRGSKPTKSSRC